MAVKVLRKEIKWIIKVNLTFITKFFISLNVEAGVLLACNEPFGFHFFFYFLFIS